MALEPRETIFAGKNGERSFDSRSVVENLLKPPRLRDDALWRTVLEEWGGEEEEEESAALKQLASAGNARSVGSGDRFEVSRRLPRRNRARFITDEGTGLVAAFISLGNAKWPQSSSIPEPYLFHIRAFKHRNDRFNNRFGRGPSRFNLTRYSPFPMRTAKRNERI